jgi:alcohol dehydrogenase class IV
VAVLRTLMVTDSFEFRARTRIVAGYGCAAERLPAELTALGARRVAVVADRGFGAAGLLEPLLRPPPGVELVSCAPIGVDPDVAVAEEAAREAEEAGAEAVLVIGGGSALCAGKAVAMRLRNPGPLEAYAGVGNLPSPPAPTIAVPTTAGSGSEVSTVVVLHDHRLTQHLVIRGDGYDPDVALLDGSLLRELPERPLLYAALDALSHAYESLWARGGYRFTEALALAAAAQIREALPAAVEREERAMQALIEASAMANLACGNSRLALVHALTSAPDVELPHGYQNGVLLPYVAEFNLPLLDTAADSEIVRLPALLERLGFKARFAPGELDDAGAAAMVAAALANPFTANNLREATEPDLRAILTAARGL